jgi:hypothetical protein
MWKWQICRVLPVSRRVVKKASKISPDQQEIAEGAETVDQNPLRYRLGLDRLVWAGGPVALVVLSDDGQVVVFDLLFGQREPMPIKPAADFLF